MKKCSIFKKISIFNFQFSILLVALATLLCACSSSDDDPATRPIQDDPSQWKVNITMPTHYIEGCPEWEERNFFDYDNCMTAIIFLPQEMEQFMSDDDIMVAVVGDEVRDICYTVNYGLGEHFMMLIPYEDEDDIVDIYYYNAKYNRTYFMPYCFNVTEDTVGSDDQFRVDFMGKCTYVIALPKELPFTPSKDDKLALFSGDICVGVGELQDDGRWSVVTYLNLPGVGEKFTARYYSAEKKTVYTTGEIIDVNTTENPVNIQFKN